jgi:hypothetical protein|tara:strand:- start:1603 stop:1824 length:222 start_codon:yes stop_codon:yes gene_type:complete
MKNLHQTYGHYLHTDKLLDDHDINERVLSYGWLDDGSKLIGYYVLTEHHRLSYNLKDQLINKVSSEMIAGSTT